MIPLKNLPLARLTLGLLAAISVFTMTGPASATGMQPETSVIVLDEGQGETSLNVKNTDAKPALLYSSIENIPEDSEALVVLTPPVVRVEAGDTQLVRFISQAKEPVKTQRLKRVLFEGIPQSEGGGAKIDVTVRQNLPLIVHPKGLAQNREPWTLLKWSTEGGELKVANDSPYVVRLAQKVHLKPANTEVELPRTYILPGESLSVPAAGANAGASTVTLYPATVYGYSVDSYDAPLAAASR
ncbi:fimbrial chaperone protein [Trinickia violacea]|uniref:Fimbrial chaperone protein n=1 Tax=Trinickia violacea TaxID=2571746 RepID=A0A4P8IVG7_9BURK|nr:fimbria/pilus chaperone family protein [Trinickia violacea]QCP52217.1 fimbrial chaperone protein [Trinickia violacea]